MIQLFYGYKRSIWKPFVFISAMIRNKTGTIRYMSNRMILKYLPSMEGHQQDQSPIYSLALNPFQEPAHPHP